jgi:hypothetical protein
VGEFATSKDEATDAANSGIPTAQLHILEDSYHCDFHENFKCYFKILLENKATQMLIVMLPTWLNFVQLPNICGSSVWNLLDITLLVPRVLRCPLDVWKISIFLV